MDCRNNCQLSIICWNSQGIRNKIVEFLHFLNQNNIDIALISESWLKPEHTMLLPGYKTYRNDRIGRNGGGVVIAVRENVPHSLLPCLNTKAIESISVEIRGTRSFLTLIAAYFPGTSLTKDKMNQYRTDLKILTSRKNSYLICGDLNAKHRSWNCTRANQAGTILFNEMCMRDFIIQFPPSPTYFPHQKQRTSPSTLDILITNGLCDIYEIHTVHALSSDHLPVAAKIDIGVSRSRNRKETQCFSKANWRFFRSCLDRSLNLDDTDPMKLQSIQQIDNCINNFTTKFLQAENAAVPKIEIREESYQLNSYTLSLISYRNAVRRKWQRSREPSLKATMKLYNDLIKRQISYSRNINWQKKLSSFRHGSRQFWAATKLLTKPTRVTPPLKNQNNQLLLTDEEKANEIANHFHNSNKITFHDKSSNLIESLVATSVQNIRFFHTTVAAEDLPNTRDVLKVIHKFKARKSPGKDEIKNISLLHISRKGAKYLSQTYRACVRLQYFPQTWKEAKIIAIPKPGKDSTNPQNYRPISLLSTLSKILENIISKKINKHLKSKNILMNEQFGFRQGHSTNHQLLRVTNYIKSELRNKRSTGMITFDIEKAFDSVWHNALLHKMLILKFPFYLIKIINSFLENRSFYVSIGESKSKQYSIPAGVPQGSVLSPILFNIFTSDLKISPKCELALFADDTAIYCSGKSPDKIIMSLNIAIAQLSTYCYSWKIKLNAGKTQATFFTKKKSDRYLPSSSVMVLNNPIKWTNSLKYLGVFLDKTLTFKNQFEYVTGRIIKYIKILYPLINRKSKLNVKNKILIFKTIFQSIMLYACPVWSNCADCHKNKLQIIQNKCLKIILKLPYYYPTTSVHKIANVPMIDQQIKKVTKTFLQKCLASENPLITEL